MGDFIWMGTLLGAVVGALHGAQFLLSRARGRGTFGIGTVWHGLWIWALWTVFGAYVLFFWLLGLVLYVIFGRSGRKA